MQLRSYIKFKPKRFLLTTLVTGLVLQCIRLTRLAQHKERDRARPPRVERAAPISPAPVPGPLASPALLYAPDPVQFFADYHNKLPVPSVILRPIPGSGGIGDQLYRYAFAYTVARDLNTTLYVVMRKKDLNSKRLYGVNDRWFALDHFRLNSSMVQYMTETTYSSIPKARTLFIDELSKWRKHELPRDKIVVVTEYWQSDMYFGRYKKELTEQLVPKESVRESGRIEMQELVREIQKSESVAVHVRRGDFHGNEKEGKFWLYRVLPITYQLRAIELMKYLLNTRRPLLPVKYFVFSDDIHYVRQQFSPLALDGLTLVFVSNSPNARAADSASQAHHLSSINEFELMSMCRHNIIANSGYAWWTAWVNRNPTELVIAPFPRHRYRFYPGYGFPGSPLRRHKEDLYWNHTYPAEWITLNPYTSYEDMM